MFLPRFGREFREVFVAEMKRRAVATGESASTDVAAGRGRAAASCIVPRSFRGV